MTHRLVLLLLGLLAAACLPAADALAFCTTRERIQLRNEGVPQMEIDRLCGGTTQQRVPSMSPQQQMPRPRFATLCMTTAGPCPMAVAMPVKPNARQRASQASSNAGAWDDRIKEQIT